MFCLWVGNRTSTSCSGTSLPGIYFPDIFTTLTVAQSQKNKPVREEPELDSLTVQSQVPLLPFSHCSPFHSFQSWIPRLSCLCHLLSPTKTKLTNPSLKIETYTSRIVEESSNTKYTANELSFIREWHRNTKLTLDWYNRTPNSPPYTQKLHNLEAEAL